MSESAANATPQRGQHCGAQLLHDTARHTTDLGARWTEREQLLRCRRSTACGLDGSAPQFSVLVLSKSRDELTYSIDEQLDPAQSPPGQANLSADTSAGGALDSPCPHRLPTSPRPCVGAEPQERDRNRRSAHTDNSADAGNIPSLQAVAAATPDGLLTEPLAPQSAGRHALERIERVRPARWRAHPLSQPSDPDPDYPGRMQSASA